MFHPQNSLEFNPSMLRGFFVASFSGSNLSAFQGGEGATKSGSVLSTGSYVIPVLIPPRRNYAD